MLTRSMKKQGVSQIPQEQMTSIKTQRGDLYFSQPNDSYILQLKGYGKRTMRSINRCFLSTRKNNYKKSLFSNKLYIEHNGQNIAFEQFNAQNTISSIPSNVFTVPKQYYDVVVEFLTKPWTVLDDFAVVMLQNNVNTFKDDVKITKVDSQSLKIESSLFDQRNVHLIVKQKDSNNQNKLSQFYYVLLGNYFKYNAVNGWRPTRFQEIYVEYKTNNERAQFVQAQVEKYGKGYLVTFQNSKEVTSKIRGTPGQDKILQLDNKSDETYEGSPLTFWKFNNENQYMLRGSSYDDFMSWLNQNEQVNQVIRAETDKTDEDEDDKDTVSDFGSVEQPTEWELIDDMNPDIGEFRVYGRGYMVRWGRDSPWYNQKFNIINLLTNYGSVELYLHKRTSNYILRGRDFVSFMSYFHQFQTSNEDLKLTKTLVKTAKDYGIHIQRYGKGLKVKFDTQNIDDCLTLEQDGQRFQLFKHTDGLYGVSTGNRQLFIKWVLEFIKEDRNIHELVSPTSIYNQVMEKLDSFDEYLERRFNEFEDKMVQLNKNNVQLQTSQTSRQNVQMSMVDKNGYVYATQIPSQPQHKDLLTNDGRWVGRWISSKNGWFVPKQNQVYLKYF